MAALVTGHVETREIACNWKVFWENYNECLHCPGIHPGLSALVPVYRKGVMSPAESPGFDGPALRDGATSWTRDGLACGPVFAGLDAAERAEGHRFVTLYPSSYIVAHADYVRVVTLTPLAPDRTALRAEWLFLPATLAQPGFDLAHVTDFAAGVLAEDAAACEMNQRGLASSRFTAARLMPQEFEIAAFHGWVRRMLAAG
jgi:Rieske 2Fe-2S family protein